VEYKVVKDKCLHVTVQNKEARDTEDYIIDSNDNVKIKVEGNNLYIEGLDGNWYVTDNNPEHAIVNGFIEEVK